MTDEEFVQTLRLGHETSGFEFKGPGPRSNNQLFARVVRAILGMANRRDGGRVIIGAEDSGGILNPVGLNEDDLATWRYDDVADGIATYADPSVSFDLEVKEYNDKKYVALEVGEFADDHTTVHRAVFDLQTVDRQRVHEDLRAGGSGPMTIEQRLVVLGHTGADTTAIYAEIDREKAKEAMGKVG